MSSASPEGLKEMQLMHWTLQPSPAITLAAYGNFTAPKAQEVAVVRGGGQWLVLLRPNEHSGKMETIAEANVFGVIRCIAAFRLVGGTRDYLVLGSDSGRVSIVQWSAALNRFVKVHEETYGKSSVRRMVPGQYVACDPKGRALMLAAFEKQKLVYVLNRDQQANLTISSPLEAHKSHMLTLSIVALDVSFDNPIFAALEADPNDEPSAEEQAAYAASGATAVSGPLVHKYLTFYELDLGLNHVTRSYSQQVDSGANLLLSVPGGESGPGGVLICAENAVYYKSADHSDELHRTFLRAPFPKRFGFDSNEKGTLITAATSHVQKGLFFFLLQSEYGDLYKISLVYEEDSVSELQAKYFDTIPVSNAMVVLKTGFLFNASESGNAYLWQFQGIGDEDDPTPFTSSKQSASAVAAAAAAEEDDSAVIFKPRVPANLALVDDMEVGAPILDFRVADLAREYTPQIYTLVGRGARSSLRVLRHGLAVSEIAVSELPGTPLGVWALKRQAADAFMSYIVVSFVGATIVLSIGETVAEVKDSGILGESNTIHVALLADDSIVQIHPRGMRRISKDRRIHEWKTPVNKEITFAACNERQIVLALKNELIYFELDMSSDAAAAASGSGGNLVDVQRKDMGTDVAAIAIAPIPEGRLRASFLSVALFNNTVRILSLDPAQTLNQVAMQAVTAQPTSLALVSMNTMAGSDAASGGSSSSSSVTTNLYLYIGLTNGILMRSLMDESAGSLSDTRKRFLGTKPVKLHQVRLRESNAVVALSSRNWLSYIHAARFQMVPLSYDLLEFGAAFSSEQCPEGIVCLSGNSLRIVTLERLGSMFNQSVLALKNTPRRMAVHPVTNQIVLIETDHNAYTEKQKIELRQTMREMEAATAEESMDVDGADGAASASSSNAARVKAEMQAAADPALNEAFMGAPHAGEGAWASSIRIVDPVRLDTLCLLSLEDNEAAFSLQILQFGSNPAWFLVVGTAQNLVLAPRSLTSGFLHVYAFSVDNSSLSFVHKTAVKDVPLALGSFHKKLAVGVGRCLRLYDLGQKQLLRKCENKNFPQAIQSITISPAGQGSPDRLYVGDLCESFAIVLYKKSTNELEIVADSTAPRYLTAQALLDIDTLVGGDKFGNIFVSRLNAEVSKQFLSGASNASSEQTIATLMNKYGKVLQGAAHKLADIANFYVGETITALQKVALVPGSSEVVLYATLQGGLGILLPFTSREDVEFFTHLEMHLRQEAASASLVGRDHLSYRGYYFPVKNVVDGDLCEMFSTHLPAAKQESVAEELVCTPQEVAKRMEDLRNRVL